MRTIRFVNERGASSLAARGEVHEDRDDRSGRRPLPGGEVRFGGAGALRRGPGASRRRARLGRGCGGIEVGPRRRDGKARGASRQHPLLQRSPGRLDDVSGRADPGSRELRSRRSGRRISARRRRRPTSGRPRTGSPGGSASPGDGSVSTSSRTRGTRRARSTSTFPSSTCCTSATRRSVGWRTSAIRAPRRSTGRCRARSTGGGAASFAPTVRWPMPMRSGRRAGISRTCAARVLEARVHGRPVDRIRIDDCLPSGPPATDFETFFHGRNLASIETRGLCSEAA